jgi:hypothetical protein
MQLTTSLDHSWCRHEVMRACLTAASALPSHPRVG